jgi:mannose-6-phosphate isomerase-like protein (cupin superfamily)
MSVEVFAPRGEDRQQPHEQDELYFVVAGTAALVRGGDRLEVASGDVLFVPAREPHRFEAMSTDFVTWVVFWGPSGGE